ncbi:cytochrome B5 [Aspergillus bombycis]|uniref:Cytochrome B5 n=1 Tax=Aspergillus bombycis TaxID=109264 RepID=A0A1F8ADP8_9EURO|nr:cytochrome B5 [Aspergillus bombycis]OGM49797.1 cytochrome B5 [Aspergillus bombycis]
MAQTSDFTNASQLFTPEDVSKHNTSDNLWTIINNEIYDLTTFQKEHPGGAKILQAVAGKDGTKKFRKYHREALLVKYRGTLRVGDLVSQPKGRKWLFFKASTK